MIQSIRNNHNHSFIYAYNDKIVYLKRISLMTQKFQMMKASNTKLANHYILHLLRILELIDFRQDFDISLTC